MIGFAAQACATLATVGALCTPMDDAGDVAFVQQATQTLLGRRPRGAAEIQVLHDIVVQHDRAALVDVLTHTDEYVDYWTLVLADVLRIQRGEGDFQQARTCVNSTNFLTTIDMENGSTFLANAQLLADHIRDDAPDSAVPAGLVAWNLKDAIRASVAVDDLHAAFRPLLFAITGKSAGGDNEVRDNLLETAFGLRPDCIGCHSSSYSTTEVYDLGGGQFYHDNEWDRTSTLGWALEEATFTSNHMLVPGDNADYDSSCAFSTCHGDQGGFDPDGYPKRLKRRVPILNKAQIKNQILFGGGDMGPTGLSDADANDVANYLQDELGSMERTKRYVNNCQFDPDNATSTCDVAAGCVMPWGMDAVDCDFGYYPTWSSNCATPPGEAWFGGQLDALPDMRLLAETLKEGIDALPSQTGALETSAQAGTALPMTSNRKAGPALLFASNVADDLIEVVAGSRTTLVHGLARNADQANLRADLINSMVVADGAGRQVFSLRGLLKTFVLSPLYNRRAPDVAAPTNPPHVGAYQIPMYFNPWAATESGAGSPSAGQDWNGQGDLVHRRSPGEVLWSLSKDLGWPAPEVYPSQGASPPYPTETFMGQIGRFKSFLRPGTTLWQFDGLLYWEQQVGLCQKPSGTDFVNKVISKAPTLPVVPTMRDLAQQVRNRLLGDMTFAPALPTGGSTEEQHVATLFGVPTLSVAYNDASVTALGGAESMLRKYCGAILLSPDYLLEAVPTITTLPPQPAVTVCLTGEVCTQTALECEYAGVKYDLGMIAACPAGCTTCTP